jgi:uncharacterized protein (TIGR04255 family)
VPFTHLALSIRSDPPPAACPLETELACREPPKQGITNSLMSTKRRYKRPPLLEAVCEIRFEPSQAWDWTLPGLLYDKIRTDFPEKKLRNSVELSFGSQQAAQQFKGAVSQMQFLAQDGSRMVQVGPDVLSVHVTANYPGWELFLPMIVSVSGTYRQISAPRAINRIGLRYVNRLPIPAGPIEITDYLNFYPRIPETIQQAHGPFIVGVLFDCNEGNDLLNVRVGNAAPTGIALDLDYSSAKPGSVPLEAISDWCKTAHDKIEAMFEASITDNMRSRFESVERSD